MSTPLMNTKTPPPRPECPPTQPPFVEHATRSKYGDIKSFNSHIETFEARLALGFINHFALVAMNPVPPTDKLSEVGSVGLPSDRLAGTLMTPQEVVTRAFDIAHLAVQEISNRGLWLPLEEKE